MRFNRLTTKLLPSYICIDCIVVNNTAPAKKIQHTTCCRHIKAKLPAPITINTPPRRKSRLCHLVNRFIICLYRSFIIAQHVDVFIVCFHKITLAGYLLNGLRVALEFA